MVDVEGPLKVSPRRILLQKFGSTSNFKPLFEQRVFKGLLKKDNPSKPKPEKVISFQLFFSDNLPFRACSNFGRGSLSGVNHLSGVEEGATN